MLYPKQVQNNFYREKRMTRCRGGILGYEELINKNILQKELLLTIHQVLFIDSNSTAQKLKDVVWLGVILLDGRHLSSKMCDSTKNVDSKDGKMVLKDISIQIGVY